MFTILLDKACGIVSTMPLTSGATVTLEHLFGLIAWSAERRPPFDWDRETAYLLRTGVLTFDGYEVRVYLMSDESSAFNREDLLSIAYAVRRTRLLLRRPPNS